MRSAQARIVEIAGDRWKDPDVSVPPEWKQYAEIEKLKILCLTPSNENEQKTYPLIYFVAAKNPKESNEFFQLAVALHHRKPFCKQRWWVEDSLKNKLMRFCYEKGGFIDDLTIPPTFIKGFSPDEKWNRQISYIFTYKSKKSTLFLPSRIGDAIKEGVDEADEAEFSPPQPPLVIHIQDDSPIPISASRSTSDVDPDSTNDSSHRSTSSESDSDSEGSSPSTPPSQSLPSTASPSRLKWSLTKSPVRQSSLGPEELELSVFKHIL